MSTAVFKLKDISRSSIIIISTLGIDIFRWVETIKTGYTKFGMMIRPCSRAESNHED